MAVRDGRRLAAFAAPASALATLAWLARDRVGWWLYVPCALLAIFFAGFTLRYITLPWWLRKITIDQWRAIDAETERDPGDRGRTSLRVLAVLLTVAVSLTLQEYIGDRGFYEAHFHAHGEYWELQGFAWWAGWRVFGYVV